MNEQRLMVVVNNLLRPDDEYIGHKRFNFNVMNNLDDPGGNPKNSCGTNGCVLGTLPLLFPDHWEYDDTGYADLIGFPVMVTYPEGLFFDLTDEEVRFIFYPGIITAPWNVYKLGLRSTKKQVAQGILNFIEWKKNEEKNNFDN